MNIPQTIFTVLYSIVWGAQAGAFGRWKMFDTGGFFQADSTWRKQTRSRFYFSTLCFAALPLLYMVLALVGFSSRSWDRTHAGRFGSQFATMFLVALCAYYAVPSFYRFWLWKIQENSGAFYPSGLCDAQWREQFPNMSKGDLDAKAACGNLLFGFIFIVVSGLAGLLSVYLIRAGWR